MSLSIHIPARGALGLRRTHEATFHDRATVYSRAANGQYTVIAKAGLKCRVDPIDIRNAPSAVMRAELAAGRSLKWEAGYTMPDNVQLEIDSRRWNFRRDTIRVHRALPGTTVLYWVGEILRVP